MTVTQSVYRFSATFCVVADYHPHCFRWVPTDLMSANLNTWMCTYRFQGLTKTDSFIICHHKMISVRNTGICILLKKSQVIIYFHLPNSPNDFKWFSSCLVMNNWSSCQEMYIFVVWWVSHVISQDKMLKACVITTANFSSISVKCTELLLFCVG